MSLYLSHTALKISASVKGILLLSVSFTLERLMYNLFRFHLLYFCAYDKLFWTLVIHTHKKVDTRAYRRRFKNPWDPTFLIGNNCSIKIISRFIIEKFPTNAFVPACHRLLFSTLSDSVCPFYYKYFVTHLLHWNEMCGYCNHSKHIIFKNQYCAPIIK